VQPPWPGDNPASDSSHFGLPRCFHAEVGQRLPGMRRVLLACAAIILDKHHSYRSALLPVAPPRLMDGPVATSGAADS
jgi:hypothetical protein